MNYYEGDNFGGCQKLEITPTMYVTGLNPVTFATGKDWLPIPFKEDSCTLKMESDDTENGTAYKYTVAMSLGRIREELSELDNLIGIPLMAKITDRNGLAHVIGAPGFGAMLGMGAETGGNATEENKKDYTLTVSQPFAAFVL